MLLQEELSGIEETEAEMEEIMKHVDALQGILGSTKKLVSWNMRRSFCVSFLNFHRKFRLLRYNDLISQTWE